MMEPNKGTRAKTKYSIFPYSKNIDITTSIKPRTAPRTVILFSFEWRAEGRSSQKRIYITIPRARDINTMKKDGERIEERAIIKRTPKNVEKEERRRMEFLFPVDSLVRVE